ncbi:uncharacterized protein LOC124810892 isoform X3 [Hydra vulgaris]|uniref:uncharacterized protein LOC105848917 isoform X2 n=1 Tax=Hydra vulgaris TaxID=6087 RepID=UPI0032EA6204
MSSQDTEGDEEVSAFFRNVQEIRAEEVLPTEIMDKLKKLEDSVENLKKLEHSMGLIFQQLKNLENSIAPQAIISGNLLSILMQFYGFYVYLNLIITVFMQLHKCLTYVTLYTFFFTFTIAPMSSYAVPSASISSAVPSAPQAIISVASISSAVPSASISSAVPSASISPAVPSTSISSAVPSDYFIYFFVSTLAPQAIISVASISSAVPSATVSTAVPPATVSTAVPPATVSTAVPPATISAGPSASYQDFLQYRSQHPGPISSRAFYRWSQYGGDDPSFRWRREAPYDTTGRRRGAGKRFNSFNFYQ